MSVCCVKTCENNFNNNRNVRYFTFPMYKETNSSIRKIACLKQRMAWINALTGVADFGLETINNKRVCSAHFNFGSKVNPFDEINPDWVPCHNLFGTEKKEFNYQEETFGCNNNGYNDTIPAGSRPSIKDDDIDLSSIEREDKEVRRIIDSINECGEELNKVKSQYTKSIEKEEISIIRELQAIIVAQRKIIEDLRNNLLSYKYDLESFRNDDKKTRYYTGLPEFVILEVLFNRLEPFITKTDKNVLSKPEMLILTLMKLRLGSQFADLGFRFQISSMTASRTFYSVLDVLYYRLKSFIVSPPEMDIKLTMPLAFQKNFGECIVYIIDCTEIYIEIPSNPETAGQCWSEYKGHHTIKFLIAITPQGVIVFISKIFGGRATDTLITTSGFMNILTPGDCVLADKGFKLEDLFEMRQANLEIPAFVYNRQQLHPLEVERTRKIANVRIHVERVIGLLKRKFLILHDIIPMSLLAKNKQGSDQSSIIDKIVIVCSALCNLCPSIIGNNEEL